MKRQPIRARMKDNLVGRFRQFFGDGYDMDAEWRAFLESIEGREVTLVFTGNDAFEQADDNYWLPDCMWDAIEDSTP